MYYLKLYNYEIMWNIGECLLSLVNRVNSSINWLKTAKNLK